MEFHLRRQYSALLLILHVIGCVAQGNNAVSVEPFSFLSLCAVEIE